ncbi:hypothetical protein LIER_02073 [Lithospermum erythrorhizon]|uniref:Uncharacterized protein n=1 Tax=Lithospermum erythrorhizon TaxID=34254 RepID=A0AAV3NN54_LITER
MKKSWKKSDFVAMEKKKVEKLEEHCEVVEKEGHLKQKMWEDQEVEKLKEHCGVVEIEGYLKKKMWEVEVKRLRENYEKECDLMRRELSSTFLEKMELEQKMKQHCDVSEKRDFEKKMLEDEMKRLRENYEK